MTLEAELLVDRRRLKRRLAGWRVGAVILAIAALAALVSQMDGVKAALGLEQHIARVTISGLIRDDREQQELLARLAKSRNVAAVILRINSRGGTTTGGEALYESIRALTEKKPVVSVFGTVAASAAYMIALASDHIVSRANTITGSVGVIVQWPEVSEMLESLGIKVEEIRSGPLKANPSPFRPADEVGRRTTKEMVLETQDWFLGLVATRRLIDPATIPGLKDGRVFSGRQAKSFRLVDALGGETTAVSWLEKERGIPRDLEIVDWKKASSSSLSTTGLMARALAAITGITAETVEQLMAYGTSAGATALDGMVSLWHPQQE